MKIHRLEHMVGGWFIGNFEPTVYKADYEVSYKKHQKGEDWGIHYHTTTTEINLLVRGCMTIQNTKLHEGDIFILEPYEIADPIFHDDCEIVCVKTVSINDKVNLYKAI